MTTHQLTKAEIDKLMDLTSFIAQKQDEYRRVNEALNFQFKMVIATEVLPRLDIDVQLLDRCVIDAQAGTIIVQDKPEEKAEVQNE